MFFQGSDEVIELPPESVDIPVRRKVIKSRILQSPFTGNLSTPREEGSSLNEETKCAFQLGVNQPNKEDVVAFDKWFNIGFKKNNRLEPLQLSL